MKVLLIYNPSSGNGRAGGMLPRVEAAFREWGIGYELQLSRHAGHIPELVGGADFSRYDALVLAGGDGTLFEGINGYFRNPSPRRLPIGVLPIGTGNAFARDLRLHHSRWEEALALLRAGHTRRIDVGCFRANGQEHYFLNILGLGFVADATRTANRLKSLGNLAYTLGVFHRIALHRLSYLTLEVDGRTLERACVFLEVANTCYTSNFFIAPQALPDDGLLDVVLLHPMPRRQLVWHFPKVLDGTHLHMPQVETFRIRRMRVHTRRPRHLCPDGEILGTTPVEIECLPRAVEVFWPR